MGEACLIGKGAAARHLYVLYKEALVIMIQSDIDEGGN